MRSGLEHEPASHFPSAGQLIDQPVAAMAGNVIQEVRNKTVVAGEGHAPVINIGMVGITDLSAALTYERRGVPAAGVGEVLGVVVAEEELQAFRHALVYRDCKCVVVAARTVLRTYNPIPKRVRSVLDRLCKSHGVGGHLVEIFGH